MQPPRMRIACFGDSTLTRSLERAGHTIIRATEPSDISGAEMVYLAVDADDLEELVGQLAAFCRRGQIFLHSCPRFGLDVLGPVERQGAVVLVSYQLSENLRSITAGDEIAATVGELLMSECHVQAVPVSNGYLKALVAGMTLAQFNNLAARPGRQILDEIIPDPSVVDQIVSYQGLNRQLLDVPTLIRTKALLGNDHDATLFTHLTTRAAVELQEFNAQWWALSEENDNGL